jgi:hypothetical protein
MVQSSLLQAGFAAQLMKQQATMQLDQCGIALGDLLGQQNAAPAPDRGSYYRMRAQSYAGDAVEVLHRLSFWIGFFSVLPLPLIANAVLDRLADKLDAATDECERFLEMAGSFRKSAHR